MSGPEGPAPTESTKPAHDRVWNIKLFQDMCYAQNVACIECGHPPKKCFVDKNQQTLCEKCSEPLLQKGDKIDANPFCDGMISKAEILCKNVLNDPDDAKNEGPTQCEWKGLVKDWTNHNDKDCAFTVVNCEDCCEYSSSRSLQPKHHEKCPFATIKCPLHCNEDILRKDTETHTKDECKKTILNCTNDQCTEQIERALYDQHVTELCPKRIVQCPYHQYGCTQNNVKYEAMEGHIGDFETKHLQFQLDSLYKLFIQQQQQKTEQRGIESEEGMIKMFGGSNIPNGWRLCNGKHGTPDLRNKFVVKKKHRNNTGTAVGNEEDEIVISEIDEEDQDNHTDVKPTYSMVYIMKS